MKKEINYQNLYEMLSDTILDWAKDELNHEFKCPFDAIVVLSAKLRKYKIALKKIKKIETGVGQSFESCEHPVCSSCEEMHDLAKTALTD